MKKYFIYEKGYWYNRFLMADKRARKWRNEYKMWKAIAKDQNKYHLKFRKEAKEAQDNRDFWRNRTNVAQLEKDNAWIAFYILVVVYAVVILIII